MEPHPRFIPQLLAAAVLSVLPTALSAALQPDASPPGLSNAEQVCVTNQGPLLRAGACPHAIEPYWFADPALRRAAGAPICWWHADTERFTDVRGVGPALAPRVVAYRDAGGTLDDLESIRGVGPSLSAAIRQAVTTACAHVPMRPTR